MSHIHQYFTADHQRLDCLYLAFKALLARGENTCRGYFDKFSQDLIRHIDWEEQVLFPFFESKSGITAGPTRVMRAEHQDIISNLVSIKEKLAAVNIEHMAELDALETLLSEHNQKEEQVLYPMIERFCQPEDSAKLFLAMR